MTFSPDGDYIYYVSGTRISFGRSLSRLPTLGGSPVRLLEDVDTAITFSPDRTRFAFLRGIPAESVAVLMVANADGTQVRELARATPPDSFATFGNLAWSPDGRTLLVSGQSGRLKSLVIFAVDTRTGDVRAVGGVGPAPHRRPG
jgi:Tol biopolymer transport system component